MTRFSVCLLVLAAAACFDDVEHTNPLDPLTPGFRSEGALTGRVTDRSFQPLTGATVQVVPRGTVALTDLEGTYTYDALPSDRYVITASTEGYASATDTANVLLGQSAEHSFVLNGLPFIDTTTLKTVHISRWWPTSDLFRLDAEVTSGDRDGLLDLEAVLLEIPDAGFVDTLRATETPGRFRIEIQETALGRTLHSLVGLPMSVRAVDRLGGETVVLDRRLSRVIDLVPTATSPQGLEVVASRTPELRWDPVFLPFDHTFRVDVVRVDDDLSTPVFLREGISPDSLTVFVTTQLDPGSYFWTVSVTDEFGNRSRSREAGFQVGS